MEAKKAMEHSYTIVKLGRTAQILLPSDLMGTIIDETPCRELVETFLADNYNGFTDEGNDHNGYWMSDEGRQYSGKYQKYSVSFEGKERIPHLEKFLAYIGYHLRQESIWIQTGEHPYLIKIKYE